MFISFFIRQRVFVFLLIILLFASVIRIWNLANIPSGFHADEAAFGYNAYSLLHTGKDEYGKFLPLTLKSFGDYKGAMYAYLTIPSIALFGLTPFAVRFPTAVFGIVFILMGYGITKRLTNVTSISLLVAILLTISPICILLSRVQSDPLVSIVLMIIALYFFLTWIHSSSKWSIAGYIFFSVISLFTYASPRIFVPLLILLLFIFYKKELLKKKSMTLFLVASVAILLVNATLFLGHNEARFNQLTIFNNPTVILPMQQQIGEEGHTGALLARIFHNKVIAHTSFILSSYFSYINYDFLFAKGGLPDRESILDTGLLYPIELPFLLLGIYFAFATKKKWAGFLLLWIFITPFLLAFASDESPNVHRFFFAILPMEVFVGYGIYEVFQKIKKNKKMAAGVLFITIVVFLFSFLYFLEELCIHQPVHYPWYRGYAYADLVSSVQKIQNNYKKVVITKALSSPYIYFLFYEKYSPTLYQQEGSPRDLDYTGFGKYLFVPDDCPLRPYNPLQNKIKPEQHVLYVNKAACPRFTNTKLLKIIYWKDMNPAVVLLEYTGNNPAQDIRVMQ